LTSPLPPADDIQPEHPTIQAPLAANSWPAATAPAATRWTSSEVFIGFTAVATLVSLFLPWFNVTATVGGKKFTGSVSGTAAHGYLWLVFALVLIVLLVLVMPDLVERTPARLPSQQQLMMGATGLSFLLVLLAFIAKPPASTVSSPAGFAGLQLQIGASFSWSYGAYIALVAAVLALLGTLRTSRAFAAPAG
jgi:hypothetical protein